MTPAKLKEIQGKIGLNNQEMARRMWITPQAYTRWIDEGRGNFSNSMRIRVGKAVRDLIKEQLVDLTRINNELEGGE